MGLNDEQDGDGAGKLDHTEDAAWERGRGRCGQGCGRNWRKLPADCPREGAGVEGRAVASAGSRKPLLEAWEGAQEGETRVFRR